MPHATLLDDGKIRITVLDRQVRGRQTVHTWRELTMSAAEATVLADGIRKLLRPAPSAMPAPGLSMYNGMERAE